jgi:hypothetical protein
MVYSLFDLTRRIVTLIGPTYSLPLLTGQMNVPVIFVGGDEMLD